MEWISGSLYLRLASHILREACSRVKILGGLQIFDFKEAQEARPQECHHTNRTDGKEWHR